MSAAAPGFPLPTFAGPTAGGSGGGPASAAGLGPALALLELCAVARGWVACDAMLKRALVRVVEAGAIMPGKYLIAITGEVEDVGEALAAGRAAAGDTLVDALLLPNPHAELAGLLGGHEGDLPGDALALIEGYSIAGVVRAADAALKAAEVRGVRLERGPALGGKALFVCAGALHDVQAALKAGTEALGHGLVVSAEIIARPAEDLPRL